MNVLANLMVVFALLAAAPAFATSIDKGSECTAVLGALADRLKAKYRSNGNRLDPTWTAPELAKREELRGTFCDASNYGMRIESIDPPVITFVYRKRLDFQPHDQLLRVELATGKADHQYKSIPSDRVIFPWPPDPDLDAKRLREQWFTDHFPTLLHGWWWLGQLVALSSVLLVLAYAQRPYWAKAPHALIAGMACLAGWTSCAVVMLDVGRHWIIGVLMFGSGGLALLAAGLSIISNPLRTRGEYTLGCALASLTLPVIAVLFLEQAHVGIEAQGFLILVVVLIVLSWAALWLRYRGART